MITSILLSTSIFTISPIDILAVSNSNNNVLDTKSMPVFHYTLGSGISDKIPSAINAPGQSYDFMGSKITVFGNRL